MSWKVLDTHIHHESPSKLKGRLLSCLEEKANQEGYTIGIPGIVFYLDHVEWGQNHDCNDACRSPAVNMVVGFIQHAKDYLGKHAIRVLSSMDMIDGLGRPQVGGFTIMEKDILSMLTFIWNDKTKKLIKEAGKHQEEAPIHPRKL